jgi:hypothetical protein
MHNLIVPFIRIDESQRDACLTRGYNPAPYSSEYHRKAFVADWEEAWRTIKAALEEQWTCGISDVDFFIESDLPEDQIVFIEVANARMIGQQLLPVLHQAVSKLSPDYTVAVCNSFVFLKAENGDAHPDFNLFVERSRVQGYSQSESVFRQLGVS